MSHDRLFVVVQVDRRTGEAERLGPSFDDSDAAEEWRAIHHDGDFIAFVVELRALDEEPDEQWTFDEVAEYLGCKREYVHTWLWRHKVKSRRVSMVPAAAVRRARTGQPLVGRRYR